MLSNEVKKLMKNRVKLKDIKIYFSIAVILFISSIFLFGLFYVLQIPKTTTMEEKFLLKLVFAFSLFVVPLIIIPINFTLFTSTNRSSVINSILKFYFLLPGKRKTIVFYGFIPDIILSALYSFSFILSVWVANTFFYKTLKVNPLPCFVATLSISLLFTSMFLLFSNAVYIVNNKTLKNLLEIFALFILFLPLITLFFFVIAIILENNNTTIVKNFLTFIEKMYNNINYALTFFFPSV